MITFTSGDILKSGAEALVNTVNCVGVMGRGVALQFKNAFQDNYEAYARACEAQEVQPGRMFVYERHRLDTPRFIINFPTKRHWRGKSRMEDIDAGLIDLVLPEGSVDQFIEMLSDSLSTNAPGAMGEAKRLVNDIAHHKIDTGLIDDTARRIARARVSPEGQEGVRAFLDKRQPSWFQ